MPTPDENTQIARWQIAERRFEARADLSTSTEIRRAMRLAAVYCRKEALAVVTRTAEAS